MGMVDDFANNPGPVIRGLWDKLSTKPGGKYLFSKSIGWAAPYTGTINGRVRKFEPGYCEVELKDRRAVRNHFKSVHAIALMNLGEMATGVAMCSAFPAGVRGIVTGLSIDFSKKARGTLTCSSRVDLPEITESQELQVEGIIRDASGDEVARVTAKWMVGPSKSEGA
jgi:acyl-coenzyme A thioesterase PaaI-like protein